MNPMGIDFGNTFIASGALNFFGQGWWYHDFYKPLSGFNFTGSTFIAKTTPFFQKDGNMKLDKNLQPVEWFPDCVRPYPFKKIVLNAVGLSSPGFIPLLESNRWQSMEKPFLMSFMAALDTENKRIQETRYFVNYLKPELKNFKAKVGLEINFSCGNIKHGKIGLSSREKIKQLEILYDLGIPIVMKVNALANPQVIKNVVDTKLIQAISVSNAIPWGELPELINWQKLFGSNISPLAKYGGGALSGAPLIKIVPPWIKIIRDQGIEIPIIGGGGIFTERDIDLYKSAGANAVALGVVIMLRPWRVKKLIAHAKNF